MCYEVLLNCYYTEFTGMKVNQTNQQYYDSYSHKKSRATDMY